MKKIILATLAIMILLLAGCTQVPQGKVIQEEEITIGFIGPLTGEVAFLGKSAQKGIQLAVDEINLEGGINGKKVKVIYEDDQLNDKLTYTAYQKLANIDNANAILTISYGGIFTISEQAEQDKIPIINTIDTSEELADAGDYVFAVGIYDEGIGYTIADFAKQKLKKEKVAIIYYQAEPFVVLVKDSFKERYESLGGEVIIEEGYAPSHNDFRTTLLKTKQAGVDTLIVLGYDEAGLALRQAKEINSEMTFIGMDTFSSEVFLDITGDAAEGAYFTFWEAPDKQEYSNFIRRFKAKYGEEPSQPLFTSTSYDSMKLLAKAMEKAEKGEALKQALYETKDFNGLSGSLTMSNDGIVRSIQETIFQIKNNNFVKI